MLTEGERPCGPNPFVVNADACDYVDQQNFKLQEAPEVGRSSRGAAAAEKNEEERTTRGPLSES